LLGSLKAFQQIVTIKLIISHNKPFAKFN